MSEKDEKRLKAIKTIYGEEAYHKGSKVTYGRSLTARPLRCVCSRGGRRWRARRRRTEDLKNSF